MKIKVPTITVENGTTKIRFVDVVVDIALGLMMATIFVRIGFNLFFASSTAGWDANTILLWGAIPWIVLAAIFIAFLRYARNPSGY